jgi:hypothetical protein
MLDGFHEPVRRDQLDKRVLHDVLDLAEVGDLATHECAQPRSLACNHCGNPIVVLDRGAGGRGYLIHTRIDVG